MRSALEPGHSNDPASDRFRAVLRAALKLAKAKRQQNPNAFIFVSIFGLQTSKEYPSPPAADLCGITDALLNDSGSNSSSHNLLIARTNANNMSHISKYIKTKLTCQEAQIINTHLKLHPDQVQVFVNAIPPEAEVNKLRSLTRTGGASIGTALGFAASKFIPGGTLVVDAAKSIGSAVGSTVGDSVEDSRVDRSEALALARHIQRDWLSDFTNFEPHPVSKVVEILQQLQDHEDRDRRNVLEDNNDNLFDAMRQYMYGLTPMCHTLKKALDAFRSKPEAEHRMLVLISDGNSTDGDPSTAAGDLRSDGISIATVKLTDNRSGTQQALHYKTNPLWDKGTRNLFKISTPIPGSTHPVPVLASVSWAVPSAGEIALFCTVYTVAALEEFCSMLLSARFGSADALLDIVSRMRFDDYINNEHLTIRHKPTNQGKRGICYAHAVASVMHMALLRIISRAGGIPSFNEIRDKILSKYPEIEDGQPTIEVESDLTDAEQQAFDTKVNEELHRRAEEHESIFKLKYRYPRCKDTSPLAEFRGSIRRALYPKYQG
ncbi:uncharacterized protein BKA55DRAFT_542890 [Fusarium redolens]|uniref:VWFA domain-containing protein n=1 Tax=Fusarium redolens TaxID=48865 RepID=A0A9P9GIS4_FUSRE|nr:uncharacterized protein BKA55DRAFT_542890 [Fusarium redolens]KAH7240304.1 hypothetical protein BKA55DRAFT_542890 [Fusarium redolens]